MKIKHIFIENFRSIKQLDIDCESLMMFIGPNNHGKTNILLALAFFFNEYKINTTDFFIKRERDEAPLIVELTFNNLTDQDKITFKSYLLPDSTIKVRRTSFLEGGKITEELHGITHIPTSTWLWAENARNYAKRDAINELAKTYPEILEMVPNSGRITINDVQEMQRKYIEVYKDRLEFISRLEEQPFLGAKNVGDNLFGEFILIPAVKDVSEELAASARTALGRLLSHAIEDMLIKGKDVAEARKRFDEIIQGLSIFSDEDVDKPEALQKLQDELSEELKGWDSKVNISLPPPEFDNIFKGKPTVTVNDGVTTKLELKGHGLQRFFMFALLRIWTKRIMELNGERNGDEPEIKTRAKSRSLFFLIEEPELFLHPQAQRQMHNSLKTLAEIEHHQVFFCTHSSFFVDMDNYKSLCIVTKPSIDEGTNVLQVKKELFEGDDKRNKRKKLNMAYWFNPDRSELFFSRKVVLVEGHSEKAFFAYAAHKLDIHDESVCFIDCGGKGNIPLYQEVMNSFGLPYIIIHDEDPIKVEEGDNKYQEQKRLFELNTVISQAVDKQFGSVEMLKPNLDDVCGISSHAKGKPLRILEKFDKDENQIPEVVDKIVKTIYS